jgi:hypothetical protein
MIPPRTDQVIGVLRLEVAAIERRVVELATSPDVAAHVQTIERLMYDRTVILRQIATLENRS